MTPDHVCDDDGWPEAIAADLADDMIAGADRYRVMARRLGKLSPKQRASALWHEFCQLRAALVGHRFARKSAEVKLEHERAAHARTQDWLDNFQGGAAEYSLNLLRLRRLRDAVKVYALAKDTSRASDAFYDMLRTAGILGATSSDPESPPTEQDPDDPPDETLPQV